MTEFLQGPPVVLLGGDEIGLSVARSLSPLGVRVFVLSPPGQPAVFSRHAEWIPIPESSGPFWKRCAEFLTGPASENLSGAVLLATVDEALELLLEHRAELQGKFLLDRSNTDAQRIMLDKIDTYLAAREAGVPVPRFWLLKGRDGLPNVAGELTYPLIVKPRHSHLFKSMFGGTKHIVAYTYEDLQRALDKFETAGLEAFLVERISGPDDLLCSYYTYLDESGTAFFDFTKRIIRRFPKNMGQATYHVTDHVPEIRELALRLFRHVGLQGVANVEFKLDRRDGRYKLIECNARFVGANPLVLRSGINIAELVYREITGRPRRKIAGFRQGLHLLNPWRDFKAYRELQRLGELNFRQWIASLMRPQTFSRWSWQDPGPAVIPLIRAAKRKLKSLWRRLRQIAALRRRFIPLR